MTMASTHILLYGDDKSWPEFRPVNDTIRGGKSTSAWSVSSTNLATFEGLLDITALGGAGFASQSTQFDPVRLSLPRDDYSGLAVSISVPRPTALDEKSAPRLPTKYVLVVKPTKPPTRPDGRRESVLGYEFEFDVVDLESVEVEKSHESRRVVTIEAPWDAFTPTYRGRPKDDAPSLDPSAIYELSFMCRSNFGHQAGPFSLNVVSLSAIRRDTRSDHGSWFAQIARLSSWIRHVLYEWRSWLTRQMARGGAVRLD